MSLMMTQSYPFSFLISYIIIFIFCLFGAFIKDCYNSFVGIEERVNLTRIFISSTVGSVLIFGSSDYILDLVSWKTMFLFCFIGGMLGFDLMAKIQSGKFWIKVIRNRVGIFKILSNLITLSDKLSSIQKEDEKEKKNNEDGE